MLTRTRRSCRFTVSLSSLNSDFIHTMADVPGVKPPQPLQLGSKAEEDWVRRNEEWNDYSVLQNLNEKEQKTQVALLRIALGPEARKRLRNQLAPMTTDAKGKKIAMDTSKASTLLQMKENAVLGQTNDTYELHMFFQRKQKDSETFDQYLNELKEKIKYCDVCDCMRDRLVKAQIIIGVPDSALQEKLLQERELNLDKCIDMCRAAESAASQVKDLSTNTEINKESYKHHGKTTHYNSRHRNSQRPRSSASSTRLRAKTPDASACSVGEATLCSRNCARPSERDATTVANWTICQQELPAREVCPPYHSGYGLYSSVL